MTFPVSDPSRLRAALLAQIGGTICPMQRRAVTLDAARAYPTEDMAALRQSGVLAAPLPVALGGLGMGTDPAAALDVMELLRLLGRGSLSVGRLFEAHLNAVRLVVRFGTDAQAVALARDVAAGHLFALWVTDAPDAPVRLDAQGMLHGAKMPCSGAGHATAALITAEAAPGETRMLVIHLDDRTRADHTRWDTHGMRSACHGRMDLSGLAAGQDALIGGVGDYLRQPDFSAGAWRGSAVALGGIEALVAELCDQLSKRGRAADPHQATRVGHALIAQETARGWVRRAALLGESATDDAGDIVGVVNLARIAVEQAGLAVIPLVQRGLGLGAFRAGSLAELLFRDLATYLRQPAPDETLIDGATHFMQRALPPLA